MIIYYLAYGILLILYCEEKIRNSDKIKRNMSILFFLTFAFLLGCRHPSMGHDLGYRTGAGYLTSFEQISRLSWKEVFGLRSFLNYEKGYIVYNKAIGLLSHDVQILLFVTALISIALISLSLYRLSDNRNIFLAIIIYTALPCFLIQFSGLRQTIAIALCFSSLRFIESRKVIPFVATVLTASLFHATALCFLFAYFIYSFPIKKKWRLITLGLLMFVFVFRAPLFQLFVRLIGRNDSPDYNGAITLFLVFSAIYLFCTLLEVDDDRVNGYMNVFFIACVCQAISGVYSSAMRMGYYYMISLPLLLPSVIDDITEFRQRELVRLAVYACFLSFGLYTLSAKGGWALSNPYHFFWESI